MLLFKQGHQEGLAESCQSAKIGVVREQTTWQVPGVEHHGAGLHVEDKEAVWLQQKGQTAKGQTVGDGAWELHYYC